MPFHDSLPKHKAELIDGQLYIGGSLAKSAMMLGYMVEALGAAYVAELIPTDLLRDAVIEVYGNPTQSKPPMADFSPVAPYHYRPQKVATDLRMGLFMQGAEAWGSTMVVKLGDDAFMPDIYLVKNENHHRMCDDYLEGPPDIVIEVVTPYMRTFDFGVRLARYAVAGLPEVWMLDFEKRSFEPLLLKNGNYEKIPVEGEVFTSISIPGLTVQHQKMFDSVDVRGMMPLQIFEVPDTIKSMIDSEEEVEFDGVPFAPRLGLQPVKITFQEYISWGGEVKFEIMDGKPVFGGSDETTREWLGMLMMTLGLAETVKYLPPSAWSSVLP
jgi:Uma2 family endonuclease